MKAPKWAIFHLTGYMPDGEPIDRYFAEYQNAAALAREMPINCLAFLRAVPFSAMEALMRESRQ